MSAVSESDLQLFSALSNPATTREVNRPIESSLPRQEESCDMNSLPSEEDTSSEIFDGSAVPRSPTKSDASSVHSKSSVFSQIVDQRVLSGGGNSSHANIFGQVSSDAPATDSTDEMLSKQQSLLELERLRRAGAMITRKYTVYDRLDDIEFEVKRHQMYMDEEATVNFMKDSLKIAFTAIEFANTKLGPFLDLDGWSAAVASQLPKYDAALSRLYRKHYKRSAMTPESELVLGILSSIGMHHCKRKFSKNLASDMGFVNTTKNNVRRPSDTMSIQEEDEEPPP
jgi:hypothetical protein